ncbi:MAG: DUF1552 domain-containing protein [Alphaproteobacteria bacterium]|nr:DUF1552 domain-containing protein [Alphaproteobacteria bacterium]
MSRRPPTPGGLSRRAVLRGAGAAVALPFLPSLLPRAERAHAADLAARPRFVAMYAPCGAYMPRFTPAGWGSQWTPGPTLEPLAPWKAQTTVLSGLTASATFSELDGFHRRATASWLTCTPIKATFDAGDLSNGWSLDQVLADSRDAAQAWPSLQLAPRIGNLRIEPELHYSMVYMQTVSWRGGLPMTGLSSPSELWRRLVGTGAADWSEMEQTLERLRGRSVLDRVLDDLDAVQQRAGADDSLRLDEYLTGLRELERSLDRPRVDDACGLEPPEGLEDEVLFAYEQQIDVMTDLLARLLACDLTRVATVMLAAAEPSTVRTWLGHTQSHHWISHHRDDPVLVEQYSAIDREQAGALAHFVGALAGTDDGVGGTLLDSTCVLYGGGMGDGMAHEPVNLPTVLVGSAGGRLRTGLHLDLEGRRLADLHLTLGRAFGLSLSSFGDSERIVDDLLA